MYKIVVRFLRKCNGWHLLKKYSALKAERKVNAKATKDRKAAERKASAPGWRTGSKKTREGNDIPGKKAATLGKKQRVKKHMDIGATDNFKAWMASYMEGGRQRVRWNGAFSSFLDRLHGVAQGSKAGHLIFILASLPCCCINVYFRLIRG